MRYKRCRIRLGTHNRAQNSHLTPAKPKANMRTTNATPFVNQFGGVPSFRWVVVVHALEEVAVVVSRSVVARVGGELIDVFALCGAGAALGLDEPDGFARRHREHLVVDEQEAGRMVVGGIGIAADGVAVAAVGRALKCSIRSNQIKSRNKDISALVKHVVPVLSPLGQKNISLLFWLSKARERNTGITSLTRADISSTSPSIH